MMPVTAKATVHMWQALSGAQYGVAKNVNLVGVRVLGCDGSGSTEAIARGIDWVAQNASGPSVANLSLGRDISGDGSSSGSTRPKRSHGGHCCW